METDDGDNNTNSESAAIDAILTYLRGTIDLCLHIVSTAERLEGLEAAPQDGAGTGSGDGGKGDEDGNEHPPECYRGMAHIVVRKLPFLLLEDTIDSLPPSALKVIWTSGPTDWITDLASSSTRNASSTADTSSNNSSSQTTSLFQRGSQFILLKSCNKLLRKLSNRDRDAAFAGSVMKLLARVFPLSERSAVNVLGTFNVTNVTEYEDEETFAAAHAVMTGRDVEEEDVCDDDEAGGGMDGVIGELLTGETGGGGDDEDGTGTVDYPFYRTFWGVQRVFTDPGGTVLDGTSTGGKKADGTAASASASVGFDGAAATEFIADVRAVLAALEGQPFPAEVVRQSKSRFQASKHRPIDETSSSSNLDGTSGASSSSSSDRHHKYLTNSQLLHLQLRDPEIRLHFLTQLLIITSYLSSTIASVGPKSKTTEILKALTAVRKRAEVLMKQTPPNGSAHLKTVEWLLSDREAMWRKWKANKCQPDLESFGILKAGEEADSEEAKKRKRRRLMMSKPLGGNAGSDPTDSAAAASELYSYSLDVKKDLPTVARTMVDCVPPLQTFLEEYVEALDPENGIEAEYHPRNDKPFAWRAMRLLARDHLGGFGLVRRKDGDFERVVRSIWKEEKDTIIPGDEPEAEEVVDLDDVRAKEEAAAAKKKAEDAASEKTNGDAKSTDDASTGDASTGSPMAEDEDKVVTTAEDKKKEFEKMAMELEEEMQNGGDGNDNEGKSNGQAALSKKKDNDAKKEEPTKGKPASGGKQATPAKDSAASNGDGNASTSKKTRSRKKRKADGISKDDAEGGEDKPPGSKKAKPNDQKGGGRSGGSNERKSPPGGGQRRGGAGGGGGRGGAGQRQQQQAPPPRLAITAQRQ
mmetsp:Transcript_27790/g.61842  ORF Transcript_27790/g.61842 Transcript_27790/m.61842 type:complete len:866 (+) Transcript_27790:473-3070(+)